MSLLRSMQDYLRNPDGQSTAYTENKACEPSGYANPGKAASYVSVALEIDYRVTGDSLSDDVELNGKPYRRLSPEYYAWLRTRMVIAKKKLPEETFTALKARFMAVRDLALDLFGEESIKQAVDTFDGKNYVGPRLSVKSQSSETTNKTAPSTVYVENYEFPTGEHPEFKFTQKVRHHALNEVDRIKTTALTAGWTEAELYQNRGRFRFPCGQDYGIVCFVDPGQRLGQVTPEKIELICRGGHSLYFRHGDGTRVTAKPDQSTTQINPKTKEHAKR